jgi:hypothetical protein
MNFQTNVVKVNTEDENPESKVALKISVTLLDNSSKIHIFKLNLSLSRHLSYKTKSHAK